LVEEHGHLPLAVLKDCQQLLQQAPQPALQ
jgi:hypothetical protein